MRLLVLEDNTELARQLKATLEQELYVVDLTGDGQQGLHLGNTEPYDLVILDLGLPLLDGLTILRRWREAGRNMPVLVLTARGTWREKVAGLRAGADDYLAKPFEFEELLARVEALLRRAGGRTSNLLRHGDIEMDTVGLRITFHGRPINLTAYEFRTLDYLMRHPDKVVSKTELIEHIYDQDFNLDSNVIEVLINRLRGKLSPACIVTRRGLGYQIGEPDTDA